MATLVNEEKVAGKYEVNFIASSLASGVYFIELKTSFGHKQIIKTILLK